jgi:hypothetical protein
MSRATHVVRLLLAMELVKACTLPLEVGGQVRLLALLKLNLLLGGSDRLECNVMLVLGSGELRRRLVLFPDSLVHSVDGLFKGL